MEICDWEFDSGICSDIKGIMSALQQIRDKAQKDGQKKNEETISRWFPQNLVWKLEFVVIDWNFEETSIYAECINVKIGRIIGLRLYFAYSFYLCGIPGLFWILT